MCPAHEASLLCVKHSDVEKLLEKTSSATWLTTTDPPSSLEMLRFAKPTYMLMPF